MSALNENGPKITIPGTPGELTAAALRWLTMLAADGEVTVRKRKAAGGGYVYHILKSTQPPVIR